MIVYCDSTGKIVAGSTGGTPADVERAVLPAGAVGVLYFPDSEYPDVYANSQRYIIVNGEPVLQPYFTISTTETTSNQYTVTVTLNNPTSTPPTSCTVSIAGTNTTQTLTNNSCTLTVNVHPSVTTQQILIVASATGCVNGAVNIGGQGSNIGLQAFVPSGSTAYTVAPSGPGSKTFLESYYALSPSTIQSLLADIGTSVNLLTDAVFNLILPALQNQTYAPITLTANQSNALSDIKANVLTNLFTTLANAYPSGGSKQIQFQHYEQDLAKTYASFEDYMSDLQNIPNLQ